MRSLTAGTTTQKNSLNPTPINIAKIEFGGSTGTKYISDRDLSSPVTAEGRVLSWGDFSNSITDDRGEVSEFSFTISDYDLSVIDYMRDDIAQGKPVTLYQWFSGLSSGDMVPIFKGVVNSITWSEQDPRSGVVSVESTETIYKERIGTFATKENFPEIRKEDIGKVLPSVYGEVERSSAVQVIASSKTTLAIDLTLYGNETVVSDGRDFPQETNIDFFIGRELIRGKFSGNKITIYGRSQVIATGTTSAPSPNFLTFRANLTPQGFNWVGYTVRFFLPGGSIVERQITRYTSPDVYGLDAPVLLPGTSPGVLATEMQAGVYFEIFGKATSHGAGEEVYEKKDEYVWIINDGPSTSVKHVEIEASVVISGGQVSSKLKNLNTIIRVDGDFYTVNLDDSQFSGTLGHNVTTITMPFDPKNLPDSPYSSDTIMPSLIGRNLTNPADIIEDIADRIGITDINATSVSTTAASTSDLVLGFTLEEQRNGLELLFDIAFQSRLSVLFESGELKLVYLTNDAGTSAATIDDNERVIEGLSIYHESTDQIINKVNFKYREKGHEKEKTLTHADSITELGERVRDLYLWAINNTATATAIATFWLGRWANAAEIAEFETYLTTLELERLDWVTLSMSNFYSSQKAQIINVLHTPGSGEDQTMDKIKFTARTTLIGGCSTGCQLFGETGCDTSCQASCQDSAETGCSYACESACQESCELICVTSCQLSCTSYEESLAPTSPDPQGCTTDCQSACMTGCQGQGCEATACQMGCTTGCTVGIETSCSTGCEVSCEVGCTTGCEFDCTSGCTSKLESGEETGCSTGCQGFCTTGCITGCTSGCQSECQDACTTNCQAASCTTGAEISCNAAGCETSGCQAACQATGCQTQSCTVGCEAMGCQGGACTASCQGCCVNTCQGSCQSACMAGSCQSSCTSDCMQAGCMGSCTSGCENNCQGGCEMGCQDCCQYDGTETGGFQCTSQCQTGCQQGCTTSCQYTFEVVECTSQCQSYCQSGCTSGCEVFCTSGCQCDCQATCTSMSCQTGCEVACQCQCQTAAESGIDCTSGTEGSCFSACQGFVQTACTTGCQQACTGYCQTGCMSGCELICQIGCQCDCQATLEYMACGGTGCETACQCQCQSTVEVQGGASCGVVGCQAGCTSGAQLSVCYTSCTQYSCTTHCESYCEDNCTTNACVTGCTSYCMTGCQSGCEYYCTIGCQCDCQATCQSSCRSGGCEQNCQCTCQTATQL